MKTTLIIVIISLVSIIAFNSYIKHDASNSSFNQISDAKLLTDRLPMKIFLAADATGSINDNGITKVTTTHLYRIEDTLKVYGGEISVLIINENCGKTPLLRITIQKQPVGPVFPVQDISETSYYFGKRLQQYQNDRKKYLVDSSDYAAKSIPQIATFNHDAEILLHKAYSKLARTSDCIGALNVASKFQMEPTRNNTTVRHINLLISDMVNTSSVNKNSIRLQALSIEYFIIRTKKIKDCMPEQINYQEFENIDVCLDVIL